MNKLKLFFEKHESALSSGTLIVGFVFDYLTLQRVDLFWDNFFTILYLVFSGMSIILIDFYQDGRLKGNGIQHIQEFLPFVVQFCFGGLFSAFIIFYSKSSSLVSGGIFILILLFFFIGNEFFKKKYSKLTFQIGIYFVALFFFLIYFLPVLIKQMGPLVFLGSGAASLILISIFIFIISYFDPKRYMENNRFLFVTVFCLYACVNLLYFTNIIPPIPLSLKTGDVYRFVEKQSDGNYHVTGEKNTWQEKFNFSQKIHLSAGEPVYVFSSIFAPTGLTMEVTHEWQHFDEKIGKWVRLNKITFPITGGRDQGYRGFSKKENIFPGKWRVDIKTERGQVIGRVKFDIEITDATPELETKIVR